MSRVYEVLTDKQQGEKQQAVVTAPANVPAEWMDELERLRLAAAGNIKTFLMGHVLKFVKGKWLAGSEKTPVADHTRYVALMSEACHGWLKWQDNVAVHVAVGKIASGHTLPDRSTLPDRDPEKWPIALSGKKEDPWHMACYLPLVSLDGNELLTFATSVPTGRNPFWKLIDRYAWLGCKHPGMYPIIEIEASGYPDKRFGWVDTPSFKIVDWTGRPDLPQLADHSKDGGGSDDNAVATVQSLRTEMDDEIPF
jgi:hypothetical protein